MSEVQVTPSALFTAAGQIGSATNGQTTRLSDPGAAAGTPAAGAWEAFCNDAAKVLASSGQAGSDLANVLKQTGENYQLADQASAASFGS